MRSARQIRHLTLCIRGPAIMLLATAALLLLGVDPASAGLLTPESGGSEAADNTKSLYLIVLYIALGVFILVEGALVYSVVKFRHRRGVKPAEFTGSKRLELGWTLAASAILVVLAVATFVKLDSISNPPGEDLSGPERVPVGSAGQTQDSDRSSPPRGDRLNVTVTGQQYLWKFTYPDGSTSYHDLVAPVNTVVILNITSQDVAHSWWIPKLGGKRDALPGYVQRTWFKSERPATYGGQCAELCGANHANMTARVRILPKAEFEKWLKRNKRDIRQAGQELDRLKPKFEQVAGGKTEEEEEGRKEG